MKKMKKNLILGIAIYNYCDIITLRLKNAAVVQRLVHLIAIQMMTVRFRSVAPVESVIPEI